MTLAIPTPAHKIVLRRLREIVGDAAEITDGTSLNEYITVRVVLCVE
jgi:hypothetical protein